MKLRFLIFSGLLLSSEGFSQTDGEGEDEDEVVALQCKIVTEDGEVVVVDSGLPSDATDWRQPTLEECRDAQDDLARYPWNFTSWTVDGDGNYAVYLSFGNEALFRRFVAMRRRENASLCWHKALDPQDGSPILMGLVSSIDGFPTSYPGVTVTN